MRSGRPTLVTSPEDLEWQLFYTYKPLIKWEFEKAYELLHQLGQRAIEYGADPLEIAAILQDSTFNKDGWWDDSR